MTPLMKSVEEAGIQGMLKKRNPSTVSAEDFFTDGVKLREAFSQLINGKEPDRCAVIPSVSYGIATVVNNIPLNSQQNIVMLNEQFPSNYYCWKRLADKTGAELRIVKATDSADNRSEIWNEKILKAIDDNTKVVAMPHIHWADGALFDLEAIRKAANTVGALLIIDGTQSVGALPFDVQKIQPDALICAGYKSMMGPYSIGMGYFGEAFEHGTPIEENWINRKDSQDFAGLVNYQDEYEAGSLRYGVGEQSNFVLVPMMLQALNKLNSWTPTAVQNYCRQITRSAVEKLQEAGYQIEQENGRASHLFGIRLGEQHDLEKIKNSLEREKIIVSIRGNAVRISPQVYNTAEDLGKLVDCLVD